MNVQSVNQGVSPATPVDPDERETSASGPFDRDLVVAQQAPTAQSLDVDMDGIWARMCAEHIPPDYLITNWEVAVGSSLDEWQFKIDVGVYQNYLTRNGQDPRIGTTALATHIHLLNESSRVPGLRMLFACTGSPVRLEFDSVKFNNLTQSKWMACFPEGERQEILRQIAALSSAG